MRIRKDYPLLNKEDSYIFHRTVPLDIMERRTIDIRKNVIWWVSMGEDIIPLG